MSIEAGITSISRYILGPVFLALPAAGLLLQKFAEYVIKLTKCRYISILVAGGILSVSLFNAVFVNLYDARQPLLYKWYSFSRDELRNSPYGSSNWIEPGNEFMRIIDKNKITKVAVSEQVVGGYYPFIYILRESKYEVKTIDMKYGSIHEDQKFEPEAVMLIHDGPNAPDIYERNGKQYYRCSNEYKLLFNNAYAALYIDEELLNLKEDCQPSFDKSLNGGCRPA